MGYILCVVIILIVAGIYVYRKLFKFPLDTAEARRSAFPIITIKRSHPSPQLAWHPALKVTKQANGLVDDERVEKNLHTEWGYYSTKEEGVKIFWQSHRPMKLDEVTNAVVFLHGYGDHCDYGMRQLALTFATLNNSWVFAFDYPGHGRSDGLWGFIGDWEVLIKQIAEVVENAFRPDVEKLQKPLFCFGGSQGGALAICLCMSHPQLFKGLVLSSPMCDVSDEIKPSRLLQTLLECAVQVAGTLPITPGKDHSKLIWKDPNEYYSFNCGDNRNKLSYSGKPRLATAKALLQGISEITSRSATEMKTPFFLLHGDSDYVCPIEKSREFYNTAFVQDKTFEVIRGGWHSMWSHNRERIYGLIFRWINERLS